MEKNYILIRYSEIALKKGNRERFEKLLINNIKESLGNNIKKIIKYPGRIIVIVRNEEVAINKLSKIFKPIIHCRAERFYSKDLG